MAAYFQADTGNGDEEPEEKGNRAVRFIRSLFSGEEDDDDTISVSLPPFMDDDLGSLGCIGLWGTGYDSLHL